MACIVYWYFEKHSITSNNGQREPMHVIQRFSGWHIRIAKHSNCKTWLQFGRTEGSITKENIAYALMGTYEHLWGICDLRDYNFDSRNTKFFQTYTCMVRSGHRPKRYLHSVFFPFDYCTSLKYLQIIRRRWFSISESSLRKYKVRY